MDSGFCASDQHDHSNIVVTYLGEVIPEGIGILQMGLRITLLRVDEMREFCRVTQEEDRCVVEDPVTYGGISDKQRGHKTVLTGFPLQFSI